VKSACTIEPLRLRSMLLAAGVLATVGSHAEVELRLGDVAGSPGQTVRVPVLFSDATNIVAAQFDLAFDGDDLVSGSAVGGDALADHQVPSNEFMPGRRRVLVFSPANKALRAGTLVEIPLTIASNTPPGEVQLGLTNVVLASDEGAAVTPVTLVSARLIVTGGLVVPGTSNPWLAGMPDGFLDPYGDRVPAQSPTEVTGLSVRPGERLSFAASGGVKNGHGAGPFWPPDGQEQDPAWGHNNGSENGISDILAPGNSLLGVFLGPDRPDSTPAPDRLLFDTPETRAYAILFPALKQAFFIGDGRSSGGAGQKIVVPDGATRLFLGTMDGYIWYDNEGQFLVRIEVSEASPTLLGQPQSVTTNAGATVTFSVTATGTELLSYEWQYNGAIVSSAANATLRLDNVQPANAGDYTVIVENLAGSVTSKVATLTVLAPPAIAVQPQGDTVALGSKVIFNVTVTGSEPLSCQWRFNQRPINEATNLTLIIESARATDRGSYDVVVSNAAGTDTSSAVVLTVLEPPRFTLQPVDQFVPPGSTMTLRAQATGAPPLSYQWRRNGVNIPGATNDTLTLLNVQPEDSGSFGAVVANAVGTVDSDVASVVVSAGPLRLADMFADRSVSEAASGSGSADNLDATFEVGEPRHAGKVGGKSVWFGWRAPADGVARFDTRGSGFDTLLAVYTGMRADALQEVVSDEDQGGFLTSAVTFHAKAGVDYAVAVDGFNGASGLIMLNWSLEPSADEVPQIVEGPKSQAVAAGSDAELRVVTTAGVPLTCQWYGNGVAIAGATDSSLVLRQVGPANVGAYTVEVSTGKRAVVAGPAALEIGAGEGAVSEDKLGDLLGSGPGPLRLQGLGSQQGNAFVSVAMGSIGGQLLNNFGSTTEAKEPNHAGKIGGASRWFGLVAKDDGVMEVDTIGSAIDTVVAVYADLFLQELVASDDNGAPDGVRSLVRFRVNGGAAYYVAVDGVRGETGLVRLNWQLGRTPVVAGQPQGQQVRRGGEAILAVSATGVPGLEYQWWHGGFPVEGATNATLALRNVHSNHAGPYRVEMWNFAGTVRSEEAVIGLLPEEAVRMGSWGFTSEGYFNFRLLGATESRYVIEVSLDLRQWVPVSTNGPVNGELECVHPASQSLPRGFYRAKSSP